MVCRMTKTKDVGDAEKAVRKVKMSVLGEDEVFTNC